MTNRPSHGEKKTGDNEEIWGAMDRNGLQGTEGEGRKQVARNPPRHARSAGEELLGLLRPRMSA